ncbi:YdeI/OmpD-associated family protein [Roseivirga sp.]|uniref:YdeI/OmpD-associated family protein n=1 Tax=Roseivirga sp. TaxID=1964215 RepID=UPI003B8D2C6B
MLKPKNVEDYFASGAPQAKQMKCLRGIVNTFPFDETVKWAFPVYTISGKNIIGLGGFKAYAGIWFFQGCYLTDGANRLVNAQEGKTHAMRQWRFQSVEEIKENEDLIKVYIQEAIDNHRAGKEFKPVKKRPKPLIIPPELKVIFDTDNALKESFEAHSLTNRRDFTEYISTAKRESTRQTRLEKIIPMIQNGIGLNDKYKK